MEHAEAVPKNSTTGRKQIEKPSTHHVFETKNSTTGRKLMTAFAARLGFGILDSLAPSLAGRLATGIFTRPLVHSRVEPETGLANHRFELHDSGEPVLNVWDWGSGPTVLLAHGWNGWSAQMSPFVAPLVNAGYFVASIDMPAHGASQGTHTNVAEMAAALVRAGRRLGPVHAVIGHSIGGAAAALALQRGLKAKRLVMLGSPARMPPFARQWAATLGLGPRGAEAFLAEIGRLVGGFDSIDLSLLGPRQTAELLILHDPADREVPFSDGEQIAAVWPGAQLRAVPGRGHTRMLREGEVVRAAVDFIRSDKTALPLAG